MTSKTRVFAAEQLDALDATATTSGYPKVPPMTYLQPEEEGYVLVVFSSTGGNDFTLADRQLKNASAVSQGRIKVAYKLGAPSSASSPAPVCRRDKTWKASSSG